MELKYTQIVDADFFPLSDLDSSSQRSRLRHLRLDSRSD
jgi:hypothetical protein